MVDQLELARIRRDKALTDLLASTETHKARRKSADKILDAYLEVRDCMVRQAVDAVAPGAGPLVNVVRRVRKQ